MKTNTMKWVYDRKVWYNRTVANFIALFSDAISREQIGTYNGEKGSFLESASENRNQNLSSGTILLYQSHSSLQILQTKKHIEQQQNV
jgi:hypothetical protein